MQRVLVTIVANSVAVAVAAWLFAGIEIGRSTTGPVEDTVTLLLVAAVLGVVNAIVAPLVRLLSLPFIILTLGLFLLLVNAAMLWLTTQVAGAIDLAFEVDGFWTYVFGALVIAIVALAVNVALNDD